MILESKIYQVVSAISKNNHFVPMHVNWNLFGIPLHVCSRYTLENRDSNLQLFNHESGALTNKLSRLSELT